MVKNDNKAFAPLDRGWAAPVPISKGQSKILFANFSTHTIVIHRGQAIAQLIPCSTQDSFITISIRHDPSKQGDIAPPEIFSCVPKKGSIMDLHLLRKQGEWWNTDTEKRPVEMMDPYNRDPSPEGVSNTPLFDISNTYGKRGLPPEEIAEVL
ncbi:hypothetical protein BGX38DRAFT_1280229 [Terfezia claveryi]|nr:hypothetical protein BGX38DRAFT_1280229 [Terfezia claveryi]